MASDLETKGSMEFFRNWWSLNPLYKGSRTNKQGPDHPGPFQLFEGFRIILRENKQTNK